MRGPCLAAIAGCLFLSAIVPQSHAKVFTHCELAQELRRLQMPESQIPTWVCIAHYESRLNTSAISGTGDHGIFQISDEYWCSPPGRGKGCGLSCADLEDDNISDDVDCVQTIFEEHEHLSGNGFNAWAVYPRCKKPSTVNRFIKKCTAASIDNSIDSPDPPLDLRFGSQTYSSRPQSFSKPSYGPSRDLAFTKTSAAPYGQDYSSELVYNSNQDLGFTRTSVRPVYQDYSFKSVYSPSQGVSSTRTSADPFYQDYSSKSVYSQDLSSTRTSANPFYQYISKSVYNPSQDLSSIRTSSDPFYQDYSSKSVYSPIQDISSTQTTANPFYRDYSAKSVYSPSQEVTYTRASAVPLQQNYDTSRRYDPYSYTSRSPSQIFVSSTVAPSTAVNPSIYRSSRPSSYSIGSIYYNPFETRSTTAAPVLYSFSPTKSFGSNYDSSGVFGLASTSAPQVYSSYSKNPAAIETSSPAPPLTRYRAPWADFPWWNGGK